MTFLLPLACYVALAIPSVLAQRETVNPDAVCYIRQAQYLLDGRIDLTVSGHWFPLLPWSIVPLLASGIDGLLAARIALTVWGALMVVATGLLLRRVPRLGPIARTLALMLVVPVAARWSVVMVTPDVVIAAVLMAFFAALLNPGLLTNRRSALWAGALAGVACYAKAYALPFCLFAIAATALLRRLLSRNTSEGRPLRAWPTVCASLLAMACVFGPWIAILSSHYGRFTLSTAGAKAHAHRTPPGMEYAPDAFGVPTPPFIYLMEESDRLTYPYWSPFDSKAHFAHQIRVFRTHVVQMRQLLLSFDAFALSVAALWLAPLIALLIPRLRFVAAWHFLIVLAYCSGYAMLTYTPRYLAPVIMPLSLVFVLRLASEIPRTITWRFPRTQRNIACGSAALAVVLLSFSLYAATSTRAALSPEPQPGFREVAARLRDEGHVGRVAGPWPGGLFVAFHLGTPFVGYPLDTDRATREARLAETGARIAMVPESSPLLHEFRSGSVWQEWEDLMSVDVGRIHIFVRTDAPAD